MTDTNPHDLHPMTNQITLKELLKLVTVKENEDGDLCILDVYGNVKGNVYGSVCGDVYGNVYGNVKGSVGGDVWGDVEGNVKGYVGGNVKGYVGGTIKGREWQFVETPKEKLKRLIDEGADKDQLLDAINQLEESDD